MRAVSFVRGLQVITNTSYNRYIVYGGVANRTLDFHFSSITLQFLYFSDFAWSDLIV